MNSTELELHLLKIFVIVLWMFLLPGGHYYHEACVSFWFQENGGFLIFGGVFILASLIGNGWIKTPPPWGFSRTTPLCYWENYETVTIICSNEILKNHITVPIFRINLRYKFRFFGTPPHPPKKRTNYQNVVIICRLYLHN